MRQSGTKTRMNGVEIELDDRVENFVYLQICVKRIYHHLINLSLQICFEDARS